MECCCSKLKPQQYCSHSPLESRQFLLLKPWRLLFCLDFLPCFPLFLNANHESSTCFVLFCQFFKATMIYFMEFLSTYSLLRANIKGDPTATWYFQVFAASYSGKISRCLKNNKQGGLSHVSASPKAPGLPCLPTAKTIARRVLFSILISPRRLCCSTELSCHINRITKREKETQPLTFRTWPGTVSQALGLL